MSELGRLLCEARSVRELTLADVEATIRVRQKYLEALEQGNYAALPPGAIARGFVRNYARFLDLDPAEVLRIYTQETGDRGPAAQQPDAGPLRPIDYRPLEVSLIHETRDNGWRRWVIALVVVAALVAGAWWVLNNTNWVRGGNLLPPGWLAALGPQQSTRTPTPAATRGSIVTITPPAAPPTPSGQQPVAVQPTAIVIGPSPTSDLLTLPIPTTQPTITPTPTPQPTSALPETTSGISLTLKTTQRSWTKVTADGNMVLQELLEAGRDLGWEANSNITVLTGNAAGVVITVNGQNLGAMGTVGQVVERSWSLNKDGNITEGTTSQAPTPTPTPAPG